MSISPLSLQATQNLRNALLAKNLQPYTIAGQFTPNTSSYQQSVNFSNFSVIDSPTLSNTNTPIRQQLYPLNSYGPSGGYNLNVSIDYPSNGQNVQPNQGEYNPNETALDLEYEALIDLGYNENRYGPEGGFISMYFVSDVGVNDRIHLPYWEPPTFIPSTYAPIQVLFSNNPIGDSGFLSQDSSLAIIGAQRLKSLFEERINVERTENIASFIGQNYKITVPEDILSASGNFSARLAGAYSPFSPIPGSYYNENVKKGNQTNQTSKALSTINNLTGGLLGPILNTKRNPSQIFLANTGTGQKSQLFRNINFNQFQPDYSRFRGGLTGLGLTLGRSILNLFDNEQTTYYVGSSKKEPGSINSPSNQIPVNEFGRQVAAPVYGPTDLSVLYEGNETSLRFGLAGIPTIEGGGIDGQFVWVSPKYKNNAGFRVTPGGGPSKIDQEFSQIRSQYQKNQSTNVELKKGSILDDTQRLINSADNVNGGTRLKHVGNAINQVSKVFNDGYKEITKGSKVLSYVNNATGREEGIEYARVFTKDTPYYTYNDLQKVDGITTSGRRFTNSVMDNTFNLNIAPMRGPDSTNLKLKDNTRSVKKYMFSIENLAWRTASRPGYRVEDLPDCEKGPNGGRIMWFPPYDLKFNDTSTPSFQSTSFLGRPEPMYTYKDTSRSGSLSWKIVVDHPSILNIIVRKQLKGVKKEKIDSILESFFAGAMKYDIYELAKRFGTIPSSVLQNAQTALQNATNTEDAEKAMSEIPKGADGNSTTTVNNTTVLNTLKSSYLGIGFYFPDTYFTVKTYDEVYNAYKTDTNKDSNFFNSVIDSNYTLIKDTFVNDIKNFLDQNKGTLTIVIQGGVQFIEGTIPQGFVDSQKRTVENYLKDNPVLKPFFDNKKLFVQKLSGNYGTASAKNSGGEPGASFDCSKKLNGTTEENLLKSTACRRVTFNNFTFVPEPVQTPPPVVNTIQDTNQGKPQDNTTALETLKAGISKKILRNLLSECDYFDMIKEDAPMVYDSLKEKIKYFNPTFHSTTPEGLNARLTFLNQCVRPGETIPVVGVNGEPTQNNALNTSFGAPPILVLRIGDFYHTKIVPTSLSFSYEPLHYDMNPEGIGIQPMIANVSMGFNIIGGMGIAKPVEQLQNALSFNFYANTEIYDERATATEDTSKLDKEVYDAIRNRTDATPSTVQDQTNRGGNTIGSILTTNNVTGGQTGDIDYTNIMNALLSTTQGYFETVVNQLESVQVKNNFAVVQILNYQRQFNFGSIQKSPFNPSNKDTIQIYGKPSDWESSIDNLIQRVLTSIDDNTNPIIEFLSKFFVVNDDSFPIRDVKNNMKEYINNLAVDFKLPISQQVQSLTQQQEGYVQTIRKLNVIVDKTDGNINTNGVPNVYNISGTAYNTLVTDFGKLKEAMDRYINLLSSGNNPIAFNETTTEISLVNKNKFNNDAKVDFFVLMARKLTDKTEKENFINFVIKNELTSVTRPVNLKNKFEKIVDDLGDLYKNELKDEKELFDKLKKRQEYKNLTKGLSKIMYKLGVERKCGYTTIKNDSIYPQQETLLNNLYASVNVNDDVTTFDGKLNFK